jgi:hypothetical protein
MNPSIRRFDHPLESPPNRSRSPFWARASRALFGVAAGMLASAAACSDDSAAPVLDTSADAGPPCEQGTQGCACFFGSGCRDGLLCITGRCLMSQGADEVDPLPAARPPLKPSRPAPPLPAAGGSSDAGSTDAADAGAEVNASDASPGLDASAGAG